MAPMQTGENDNVRGPFMFSGCLVAFPMGTPSESLLILCHASCAEASSVTKGATLELPCRLRSRHA